MTDRDEASIKAHSTGNIRAILAALVVYVIALVVLNILHFRYLPVNVVFYATLLDVAVCTGVLGACLLAARSWSWAGTGILTAFRRFTGAELFLVVLCTVLIGYVYAISAPTVIDRSLSIYLLEKIQQRGGAVAFEALDDIVIEEFMPEHRLIDVRMTEQLNSGTVTIDNGCVQLTVRGRLVVRLTRFIRTRLLPKKRVLMGEVSDDLTDPFRSSEQKVDYRCSPEASGTAGG